MQLWSQSWAKAQMWTRASGFSEGPQKLCSPGLLSCRVSFQSPFSPGACHIFPGTRCRSRFVCVVARGLSLPAGKAIAGLRCGPWKGHSFYVLMSACWKLCLLLEEPTVSETGICSGEEVPIPLLDVKRAPHHPLLSCT